MSGYISFRFEKDVLINSNQVRIIARNIDQGDVPPNPSVSYFPTDPDDLEGALVLEHVSEALGERYIRVATLTDYDDYSIVKLNTFIDTTADFVAGGVANGDRLEVILSDTELWQSEEYLSTPFPFVVESVIDATTLQVYTPFPVYSDELNWQITARGLTGSNGKTRREGTPAPGTTFRDTRFQRYFTEPVQGNNFVAGVKAGLNTLANELEEDALVSESYTAIPSTS